MFTLEQLTEMFALQEQLEIRIGGVDWREQGHDYPLCIMMECAEIINHYGWKHWKDTEKLPDINAIKMEIVDIWHFIMALMLTGENFNIKAIHKAFNKASEDYEHSNDDVIYLALGLGFSVIVNRGIPFGNFIGLMYAVDMTFDSLYKLYISKNLLNKFRQEHGYKEGTYNKIWAGREDNEYLLDLCDKNEVELYDKLSELYTSLSGGIR